MKPWSFLLTTLFLMSCGSNGKNDNMDHAKASVVKNLSEELRHHPDSSVLRMQLINSLDSLQQFLVAIKHTDSLLAKDSMNEGLWVTKAHLQESNRDTINAIISYEKAISIYPAIEPQLYLANLFAEKKNPKALWLCTNVLKMGQGRETDANCSFIAAIYFARIGNSEKAIEGFDKAIADNYTLTDAYLEKGFIYYDKKDYNQALKIFQTARKVSSTNADVYYWIAKCNEAMGNKEEALINYQRALGLDRNLKDAKAGVERMEG